MILAANNETEREEKKDLEENGLPPSDSEPDLPVVKPLPGTTSHGVLSGVPMPIPPKALGLSPKPPPTATVSSPTKGTSVPAGTQPRASALALKLPSLPPPASSQAEPPNQTMQDLKRVTRGFIGSKSAQKWLNQLNNRGWTPEQIEEAVATGESFPADNRIDPEHDAIGYVHPRTGRYVIIDKTTGEIIQLSGDGFQR